MANDWFPESPPKTPGEIEQFFLQTIKKLKGTGASLSDIDQRSINPLIGMVQEIMRRIDSLIRDGRNIKADFEGFKRIEQENRTMKAKIYELERRINNIEGEF